MARCAQCGRQLPSFSFGRKICAWCVQHEAAQRGEEPEDAKQTLMPVPWAGRRSYAITVTQVILGINVAVFLGMVLAGVSPLEPTSQELVQWGANWRALTLGGEWWRLLSSVFVHIGILHIGFNMWCLWDLGALCESLYGRWTFAAVYLICGVAASLTSVALHPNTVSAGASGAIFGIAGALIASFYLGEFSMPRAAVSGTLRSVVMFAGYNLVFGAISGFTDNAAHIGGLVSGLILGALIAKVAPDGSRVTRRLTVLLVVALAVAGGTTWLSQARGYPIHTQRGFTFLQQNRIDQAIAELQRAVQQRPDDVLAHYGLGRAHFTAGNFSQAVAEWKRVTELDPDLSGVYYNLGLAHVRLNQYDEAITAFRKEQELSDDSYEVESALAEAYRAKGMSQQADEAMRKAAELKAKP